jgi:PAS domain S-box-containing protein
MTLQGTAVGPRRSIAGELRRLVLLAVLPLALVVAALTYASYHEAGKDARAFVMSEAAMVANDVTSFLAQTGRALNLIARRPGVAKMDPAQCDPALGDLIAVQPRYLNIFTVDRAGRIICSTAFPQDGTRSIKVSESQAFLGAMAGRPLTLGAVRQGPGSGQWISAAAAPLRDAGGSVTGALVVAIDLAAWWPPGTRDMLPPGAVIGAFEKTGRVALRNPEPEHWVGRDASQHEPFAEAMRTREGTFIAPGRQGFARIWAVKPIPGTDWIAFAGVRADTAFATANRNAWIALALALAALLASVWAAVRAARRLAVPITDLAGTAAQAALQASEARTLVDSLPAPVFVHRNGLLLYLNAEATRLFGAARAEDLIGTALLDRVHPEFRDILATRSRQTSQEGKTTPLLEHKFLKLDGTPIAVETQGAPIQFDGQPAIMSVGRDISSRRAAEAKLDEARELSLAIMDSVAAQIAVLDRDGTIIAVNAAWRRFSGDNGCVPGEPAPNTGIGSNYLSVCRTEPEVEMSAEARLTRDGILAVLHGKVPQFEFEYPCRSPAEKRWFSMSVTPLRAVAGGAVIAHTDITQRVLAQTTRASLEAQLRESQKMAAIGTLAGGIAHDFNNILATILGNTDLAHEDALGNGAVEESLDEIRRAGLRGRDLVKQILAFSRRQPTERKRLDLAVVVEDAARLLRFTLPARIALEVQCAPGLPATLADATQIEQVVLNLATNAMQAMQGASGRLLIALDAVELSPDLSASRPALHRLLATHPGRVLRLTVSDNGPGMAAEVLERIFEPFFTTKPVGEGTGLGLAVVHGIVENHEGAIEAVSTPGAGTAFTLYLPCADPLEAEGTQTAASSRVRETASGSRVLYIDDDAALVSLVTRLLVRRGFRVSAHTNQKAALAELRADPAAFDLVVTDYNMPGLSGLDVARAVREIRPGLPVAVTSGFVDEALTAQAAEAGVREVLFKATSVDEYCAALQRLVRATGGTGER